MLGTGLGLGRSGSRAFLPSNISGLAMWLRADKGVTLNGSNVSSWADQSGNGVNASQSTAGAQPPLISSWTNGKPGLSFTGSTTMQTSAALNLSATAKCTVFLVASGSLSSTAEILEFTNSAGTNAGSWNIVAAPSGAGTLGFTANADGNATHLSQGYFSPGAAFTGAACQLNCIFDMTIATGMQETVRFNRAAQTLTQGASAAASAVGMASAPLNIGSRSNGGSLFWTGTQGEIIVYGRALTNTEIVQVENYISNFWGTP